MHHTATRSLVAEWSIVTCLCLKLCGFGQWQRLVTAIARMPAIHIQLLRKDGCMSAVALGVCHGSLTHRGWHPSSERVSVCTLRQSYITPHCPQCPPATALKLRLVPVTASRPLGEGNRRYAKLPTLKRLPAACTSRSLRALRAVVCRPSGVLASWHWSGALRNVFSSRLRRLSCVCPRPPLGLACFAASPARSARPPPKGAPSEPRIDTPPGVDMSRPSLLTFLGRRCGPTATMMYPNSAGRSTSLAIVIRCGVDVSSTFNRCLICPMDLASSKALVASRHGPPGMLKSFAFLWFVRIFCDLHLLLINMKYRIARIPKGNGGFRYLYIASEEDNLKLRSLLPVLESILTATDTSKSNYAFQRNKNCVLNAMQHIGHRYTLSMDLEDFFNSIVPSHVSDVIPADLIKQCFLEGHPRQGLPTSPIISSIAFLPSDKKIIETLGKLNIDATYTRYADDLIFSFNNSQDEGKIRFIVKQIVENNGFKINRKKTTLQDSRNGRVIVTGIAVDNRGLYATRHTKRKMRAASHQRNEVSLAGLTEWSKCKLPSSAIA